MKTLKEEIEEIVNSAVYESGAGNDVLISNDIDNLVKLFKKWVIGEIKKLKITMGAPQLWVKGYNDSLNDLEKRIEKA